MTDDIEEAARELLPLLDLDADGRPEFNEERVAAGAPPRVYSQLSEGEKIIANLRARSMAIALGCPPRRPDDDDDVPPF
jgi:hypothetical protein